MSGVRRTPKAYDYVTEKRMVQLMSEWAKAADASITEKLADLKAELRAEFTMLPAEGAEP